MMDILLQIGFGLLILGLDVVVIWVALNVMDRDTPQNFRRLRLTGIINILIGAVIIAFGIVSRIVNPSLPSTLIISAGAVVVLLGCATLIRIWGQKHTSVVWGGALITTGVGVGFVLSYLILYLIGKIG
jgi:hypothetical protein